MKPISLEAKRRYFLNYVGFTYERRLTYSDGTPAKKVGPYKLSGQEAETADWFARGQFVTITGANDVLILRDIDNLSESEIITLSRVYKKNIPGGEEKASVAMFLAAGREVLKTIKAGDTRLMTPERMYFAYRYLESIGVALPTIDLTTMETHTVESLVYNKVVRIVNVEHALLKFNTFCFTGSPVNRESMGIYEARTATEAADMSFNDRQKHISDDSPYADKYRDRNNWRAWK